jgi:hypothetical protein
MRSILLSGLLRNVPLRPIGSVPLRIWISRRIRWPPYVMESAAVVKKWRAKKRRSGEAAQIGLALARTEHNVARVPSKLGKTHRMYCLPHFISRTSTRKYFISSICDLSIYRNSVQVLRHGFHLRKAHFAIYPDHWSRHMGKLHCPTPCPAWLQECDCT